MDDEPAFGLPRREPRFVLDLLAAALAVLLGVLAVAALPPGSPVRFLLALPTLLVAPGYLLLQVLFVERPARGRRWHALAALGISPALVGLASLAPALVPGGFQPAALVASLSGLCFLLAGLAWMRRRRSSAGARVVTAAPQA
jgi:uncharacterized membrane protein